MNLLSVIAGHQNSLLQLYRKLEQRFEENSIIKTLWSEMAGDVSLQIQSLKSFPSSLWTQLKNASDDDFASAVKSISSPTADVAGISLRDCFETSLALTEPVVLKIYARIVRLLRKNSTAPALNFYILVKAYIARLARTTESYAGDPLLVRRAQLLIAGLEREVQDPDPEIKAIASRALSAKEQKTLISGKTKVKPAEAAVKNQPKNVKSAEAAVKNQPKNVKSAEAAVKNQPKNGKSAKTVKSTPVKTKTLSAKPPVKTRRA